jgi:DNA-binding transcriptional LysR family regulator
LGLAGIPKRLNIYRWASIGPQGKFAAPVPNQEIVDDGRAMLALALNGFGLMDGADPIYAPHAARGDLEHVLPDWSTTGRSHHLYCSTPRQVPPGPRLLLR